MNDIEIGELATRLGEVAILDVRTPGEYDGSGGSHCDPRQGHIPGAVNIDISLLTELDPGAIAARVGTEPGGEVVVYCHARNYVGSWHEWSRHDELPLEP
jgi:thiosulfate/3-mercaptopyruvate sulfurtransferase